jgi:hypothetical protein
MNVSMRSGKNLHSAFAIILSLLLLLAPLASAQECLDPSGNYIGTTQAGSDGVTHIKYRFRDENGNEITPPQSVVDAMTAGAGRWNQQSGTTKVVFEAAGPNDYADLLVIPTSDQSKSLGCAAVDPLLGYLYYDPALVQAAGSSTSDAATVLAHELGHFLGLDDAGVNPSPATIMNNPGPGMTCTNFSVPTTSPTAADATKASQCTASSRLARRLTTSGGRRTYHFQEYNYGYSCYDQYMVTDYYYCTSESCTYLYSDWEYLGMSCY